MLISMFPFIFMYYQIQDGVGNTRKKDRNAIFLLYSYVCKYKMILQIQEKMDKNVIWLWLRRMQNHIWKLVLDEGRRPESNTSFQIWFCILLSHRQITFLSIFSCISKPYIVFAIFSFVSAYRSCTCWHKKTHTEEWNYPR